MSQTQLLSLKKEVDAKFDAFVNSNDESARVDALETTLRLSRALDKPADAILKLSLSPSFYMAVKVGRDLDVFTTLAGSDNGSTIEQLAAPKKADPGFVERIMRALVAIGFANELGPGLYSPSSLSHEMTREVSINSVDILFSEYMPTVLHSPTFFAKTNYQNPLDPNHGPIQHAFNTTLNTWDWFAQNPEALARFNVYMKGARGDRPHWVDWFPVQQEVLDGAVNDASRPLLVDIAGGIGTDIAYFVKRFPDVQGRFILEDLPSVIDDIQDLDGRIERVKHDYFTPQPIKGARIYYMRSSLHDWSDTSCTTILTHIASAMERGYSKLLIEEFILPETDCRVLPVLYDMAVMFYCSGIERTRSTWEKLLARCGFVIKKFWAPGGDAQGIIEAELQ
ncbi:hypothetical protein ASPWEDRAFT_180413 [Aspergillus wentii DTO 134E9]|uniref:Uncharacterized protein n=1 Tax=Aspergillus wentii DTO 134E9 TaxID=1073089 RepID=A0A1L9RVI8_ASPWE|nr:uncharacterized protein ASPWEDRAFT_180413 [Aspergillus wentii DTO 134E9]KAI9928848.1 hypothetical protein MW887_002070 [Aspergillus wentii]OJJ38950.1 hypothetical protein ASPWEDRAFT_180413 [Aspergillus wentii DTO 134E9]